MMVLPTLLASNGWAQEEKATPETPPPQQAEPAPAVQKAVPEDPPRVLIMDLKNNGVEEKTVNTLQGIITVQISDYESLDVISGDDVRQLVALQAEKQNTGCSDDGSCMAEIAGALGASLVVFGNVGQLGELLVVNLNLFNVDLAQSQGRVTIEAPSLESFPSQLKPKVWDLLTPKIAELGFTIPDRPEEVEPVMLVKEIQSETEPLFAWPSAFFAGTLFLAGAGGAGYWTWGVLPGEIVTATDQRDILEGVYEADPNLTSEKEFFGAETNLQNKMTEQTMGMAITIATGVLGLTGMGLGLFWNPSEEEASSKE